MLPSRHLSLGVLLPVLAVTAHAQTVQWANLGNDFSSPVSWVGNVTLTSSNVAEFATTGTISFQPQVNSAQSVGGLTFAAGAGSFNITGSGSLTIGSNGIDNEATSAQTIAVPMTFSSSTSSIFNNGTLTINGLITNNASSTALTITNNGFLSLAGGLVNNAASGVVFSGTGVNGGAMSIISGSGPVTVSGPGTWTFAAANTYSGSTTVSGGSLAIAADNNLGAAPVVPMASSLVLNGGTLDTTATFTLNSNRGITTNSGTIFTYPGTTLTYGGVIADSGAPSVLNKDGTGTLVLTGTNTYSGGTNVLAGVLQIGNGGASGVVHGNINNLSSVVFDQSGIANYSGVMSGPGTLKVVGSGAVTLSGSGSSYSGGTFVASGALQDLVSGGFSPASQINLAPSTVLSVYQNETIAGLNDISGGGGAVGILGTTITLTLDGGGTFSGVISGGGNLTLSASSPFVQVLTGNNAYTGGTTIGAGTTLQIGVGSSGVGGTTGSIVSGNIVDNGTFMLFRQGAYTYGGISGTGSVWQTGSGTLTLSGSNTYSGGTFINSGAVTDQNAGAFSPNSAIFMYGGALNVAANEQINGLGDWVQNSVTSPGTVTIGSGATLTLRGGSSFSGSIGGSGALSLASGTNETVAGTVNPTGGTTIQSGATLQIGSGGTTGTLSGAITNNGSLQFNESAGVTVSGITGSGNVTQMGAGTLTLAGSNSYSGRTQISNGSVSDGAAGALSPNSGVYLQASGTALNVNFNETINGLGGATASAGSTTNLAAGATLTIKNNGLTYNGTIQPLAPASTGGTLVLTGPGSETFGGANTYTGGTTINGGTLIVTNTAGSGTGTGTVTIASGAALQLGANGAGGMVSGNIVDNGNVLFASTSAATYGGLISGTGSLSVGFFNATTTGSLTLTGANTYSGFTSIGSGTLVVGTANALPTSTALVFGSTGILDVAHSQTIGRFANSPTTASVIVENGSTLTVAPSTGTYGGTFGGTVNGSGSLTIAGASGTGVTLANASSAYSGGTTVSGGTLYLAAGSIGSAGAVTSGPVGTGAVTVASTAGLGVSKTIPSDVVLANDVTLASGATLSGGTNGNWLNLSGNVAVPTGSASLNIGSLVQFSGSLKASSGSTALTINSAAGGFGNVLFTSAPDPSITSLSANGAGILFASQTAVPISGLTLQASNGYVGIVSASGYTTPTAASVLNLISNRATFAGTLGFDTGPNSAPHVFADNLDLTGFASGVTLGSESSAVLTGTITPSSSGYSFGNGGGALFVQSALTGAYPLTISSNPAIAHNTLLTVLEGANTFTGAVTVSNAGLILDSPGALPTGATVSLGTNGYVGLTEAFTGVSSFADFLTHRLGTYTSTSIVGLDSNQVTASVLASGSATGFRYNSEAIDLSGLSSIYFGTATNLVVNGVITAPNHGGTLSLLAGDQGHLVIASPLLAGNVSSVVLGSATAPFGKGSIALEGANTYTGGTQVQGGTVVLGQSSRQWNGSLVSGPVGTGTLTIASNANSPTLVAGDSYVSLDNPIALGSALRVGVPYVSSDTSSNRSLSTNYLSLNGVISDVGGTQVGSLDILGYTALNAANTFSGGVTLESGGLFIGNNAALGTGTFTLAPTSTETSGGVWIETSGGPRTLANNIVYNGPTNPSVWLYNDGGLTLSGTVTLNNSMNLFVEGSTLNLNGPIGGAGRLTLNAGSVVLNPSSGSNTFTGGVVVNNGNLVFASANALPASSIQGLTTGFTGYIGVSFMPSNLQTDFLDKFNKFGSYGTIGLDSVSGTPNSYGGSIDLSGFSGSARLGSATSAIIAATATIVPQSFTYNFGGGGGALRVDAALTDAPAATATIPRSVLVSSIGSAPLTLTLTGANTYTGSTTADSSAIVFGSSSAVPTNSSFLLTNGGYIGLTLSGNVAGNDPTVTGFLGRFTTAPTQGYVGFDAGSGNTVTNLDLTALGIGGFGLSTTTNLHVGGTLTIASGASAYNFAGYKGGQLTIDSVLSDGSGARSVVIGSASVPATFVSPIDPNGTLSGVTLTGANTYTGGTTLNAGNLYLGSDTALGTGTLTIAGSAGSNGQPLGLFASGGSRTIANPIVLSPSSYASLDLGGVNNLTLNGGITGGNMLEKVGVGTLTLGGNNTGFSGDVTVKDGGLVFTHGVSVGSGFLNLSDNGGTVTFLESSTVDGISGYSSADTINVASGTTLTINQTQDDEYMGTIAGSNIGLSFTGNSTHLHLNGASAYTGTTTVGSGVAVVAGNATAFGAAANPIVVNGGKLAVDSGVTIANPITLTSGKLGGSGTFMIPAGGNPFSITSGIILAPGIGGPGNLTLDGSLISTSALLLASSGGYNWQILDATNAGGWDTVTINGNVDISATTTAPFNFSLISLGADRNSGYAANFDPLKPYSWTVLTANHINGFTNPAQFNIDTSSFMNATSGGSFTFTLNSSNTSLLLNFTPVPEPSTYALMLAGAAATFLVTRRRRNRRG